MVIFAAHWLRVWGNKTAFPEHYDNYWNKGLIKRATRPATDSWSKLKLQPTLLTSSFGRNSLAVWSKQLSSKVWRKSCACKEHLVKDGGRQRVSKAATEHGNWRWSCQGVTDNSFRKRDKNLQYACRRLFCGITKTSQMKKKHCGALTSLTGTFDLLFVQVSLRAQCHKEGFGSGKGLLPCTFKFHTC